MGAEFSKCGTYRYALWRIWDIKLPMGMLIGLNPSTANKKMNDPTITRLGSKNGLMRANGFGGMFMTNLFAQVTPYPEMLEVTEKGVSVNDEWLQEVNLHCETVIFCWGNFKVKGRDLEMKEMFPSAMCFGKNRNGSPKHPLYLKADTKLVNF